MTTPTPPRPSAAFESRLASFLIAAGVTLAWNGESLWRGFFRLDDFAFLHANGGLPLRELLLLPHNEHFLPIWRLEVAALDALFGIHPVGWIAFGLLVFALMLFFVQRVLVSWGVTGAARAVAVIAIGGWSQWGEILSGYFTLVIWIQLMVFACAAFLLQRRVSSTQPRARDILALGILLTITAGFGEASLWVPVALLMIALVDIAAEMRVGIPLRAAIQPRRWPIGLASVTIAVATSLYILALSRAGPELMRASHASAVVSISTRGALLLKFLADVTLAPWRVIHTAPIPDWLAAVSRVLTVVATAAAIVGALWRAAPPLRRAAAACALIIGFYAALVTLGRPFDPGVWPAKHIGVPFMFLAMLASLAVQAGIDRAPAGRLAARPLILAAVFFLVMQLATETFAMHRGWPEGRREEWVLAGRRRAAVAALRDSIVAPQLARGTRDIPNLSMDTIEGLSIQLQLYDLIVYDRFVIPPGSGARIVRTPGTPVIIPP